LQAVLTRLEAFSTWNTPPVHQQAGYCEGCPALWIVPRTNNPHPFLLTAAQGQVDNLPTPSKLA
jgi:hypothetical protein